MTRYRGLPQAGTIMHDGRRYRIRANLDALGRLAAAASLNLQGPDGWRETRRFLFATIDDRDRGRYLHSPDIDQDVLGAKIVAQILGYAAHSPDPELREWSADFRATIIEFRAGDLDAFQRLAASNAQRWAV